MHDEKAVVTLNEHHAAIERAQRRGYDTGHAIGEHCGAQAAGSKIDRALFIGTLIGMGVGTAMTIVLLVVFRPVLA